MDLVNIKTERTLEELNHEFEILRREWQSSKDRSVKQTNARLDAMEDILKELQQTISEMQTLLTEYLIEETNYVQE